MSESLLERAADEFRRQYGIPAAFCVRAPGRVNLLGEHTDYNGLPVLPMAIDRCVAIAARPRDGRRVRAVALDWGHEIESFELAPAIPKHPQGHWMNYIKAGMQGILAKLCPDEREGMTGCDMVIAGNIPAEAGLSSSSALVVASAMTLLHVHHRTVGRLTLAEWMAEAEWYVGTRGGGMDQAVCLLGQPDHALQIDFFPLRAQPVSWPKEYAVVLCDSGVRAKKSESALRAYNFRSAECRLAARLLNQALAWNGWESQFQRLGDLLRPPFHFSYTEIRDLAESALRDTYRYSELVQALGEESRVIEILRDCSIPGDPGDSGPRFHCGKRYRHVAREALRVVKSRELLDRGEMEAFGELMLEGHASARDDFEISCPPLDQLVRIAMESGAVGARLTGAGFGGCTVNVVRRDQVKEFLAAVRSHPGLPPSITHPGMIFPVNAAPAAAYYPIS